MISNVNFMRPEIPQIHPKSNEYKEFWRQEKKACIEGLWSGGKWMPGPLYFYVNYWHIKLNKSKHSKVKSVSRPHLRDIEWDKAYVYTEAKGFSGFELDKKLSCCMLLRDVVDESNPDSANFEYENVEDNPNYIQLSTNCFTPEGKLKEYVHARAYLRKFHGVNLGSPLFENEAKNVCDIECRGSGKDLLGTTLLHYVDGSKRPIKDVLVGDRIFGADGQATTVTQRRDFTDQMQYEVVLADGRKVTCGGGHLWTMFFRGKVVTKELNDIKDSLYWQRSDGTKDYKYALPVNAGIQYEGVDPNIDPYYFGLWIGDGNKHNTGITTMDDEIVDFLEELRVQEGMSTININRKEGNKAATYFITNGGKGGDGGHSNQLKNKLRDLGVLNNKHIPKVVLNASFDYRLAVLQGIMDSDGSCDKGHVELTTSYEGIQDTILELLSGLGIKYNARMKKTTHRDALRISLHTTLPVFRLTRKIEKRFIPSKATLARQEKVKIVSVTPVGVSPSVCIAVDNEDHLFIVDDYVVTHNSYWASGGMIGHNFLMDGAVNYQDYRDAAAAGKPLTSETLVGAITTSFSADLLSKFSLGLESLEGGIQIGSKYYPSPLYKQTKGTLAPGKNPLYAGYDKKIGGTWKKDCGSGSKIHHRSFKDKPTAGNGTRPGLVILEEVGFMGNLKETLGPLRMCTADGAVQFGTTYMFGTGGDMDGGSTQAVMEVFFEPEAWDCLAFPDNFESNGERNIGYFVPYTLGLNQFKDSEGNSDVAAASAYIEKTRAKLAKASSKTPLNDELQNNPIVPSEAFLVTSGNIFPIRDLQEQLTNVMASTSDFVKGQLGKIGLAPNAPHGTAWYPDIKNELEAASYPVKKGDDMEGAIQIWEHPPTGIIPKGMYIAATDPYDQDQAGESSSLGSTLIYKIGDFREGGVRDMIVAEYTGRPATAKEHHENVRRLCMHYNALNLYENEKNSMKFHFEANNSLYLLSNTPSVLKANASGTVQRTYGQHMTAQVKSELEIFARDWLNESRGDGLMQLNMIYSAPLLKELIMYNDTGNFDRVISFLLLICNRMQHHNVVIEKKKEIETDGYFMTKKFE